jgi:hypothetical protein
MVCQGFRVGYPVTIRFSYHGFVDV